MHGLQHASWAGCDVAANVSCDSRSQTGPGLTFTHLHFLVHHSIQCYIHHSQVRIKLARLNFPADICLVMIMHQRTDIDRPVSEAVAALADWLGEPAAHVMLFPVDQCVDVCVFLCVYGLPS